MREGQKTLAAALAVLLLGVGLIACGGDDEGSGTTTAAGGQGQAEGKSASGGNGKQGKSGSGEGTQGSGAGGSGSGSNGAGSGGSAPAAADFTPKQHKDSGGGSKQYRVKGGDNSVQEFGQEAGGSEFDAAAIALHNFLDARAEGNWAAACNYMAKSIVESFEKLAERAKEVEVTGCAEVLEKLTNPAAKSAMKAEAAQANVGSLRTEGDRSFLIYTAIGDTILAMPMTKEDGVWKVGSLAGTPLN